MARHQKLIFQMASSNFILGRFAEGLNVVFVRYGKHIRMWDGMMCPAPIDEVLVHRLVLGVVEFLVVATIEQFNHAANNTLDIVGQIDNIALTYLGKLLRQSHVKAGTESARLVLPRKPAVHMALRTPEGVQTTTL